MPEIIGDYRVVGLGKGPWERVLRKGLKVGAKGLEPLTSRM